MIKTPTNRTHRDGLGGSLNAVNFTGSGEKKLLTTADNKLSHIPVAVSVRMRLGDRPTPMPVISLDQ